MSGGIVKLPPGELVGHLSQQGQALEQVGQHMLATANILREGLNGPLQGKTQVALAALADRLQQEGQKNINQGQHTVKVHTAMAHQSSDLDAQKQNVLAGLIPT